MHTLFVPYSFVSKPLPSSSLRFPSGFLQVWQVFGLLLCFVAHNWLRVTQAVYYHDLTDLVKESSYKQKTPFSSWGLRWGPSGSETDEVVVALDQGFQVPTGVGSWAPCPHGPRSELMAAGRAPATGPSVCTWPPPRELRGPRGSQALCRRPPQRGALHSSAPRSSPFTSLPFIPRDHVLSRTISSSSLSCWITDILVAWIFTVLTSCFLKSLRSLNWKLKWPSVSASAFS